MFRYFSLFATRDSMLPASLPIFCKAAWVSGKTSRIVCVTHQMVSQTRRLLHRQITRAPHLLVLLCLLKVRPPLLAAHVMLDLESGRNALQLSAPGNRIYGRLHNTLHIPARNRHVGTATRSARTESSTLQYWSQYVLVEFNLCFRRYHLTVQDFILLRHGRPVSSRHSKGSVVPPHHATHLNLVVVILDLCSNFSFLVNLCLFGKAASSHQKGEYKHAEWANP